jgi:hypothetical protein
MTEVYHFKRGLSLNSKQTVFYVRSGQGFFRDFVKIPLILALKNFVRSKPYSMYGVIVDRKGQIRTIQMVLGNVWEMFGKCLGNVWNFLTL